MHSYIVTYEGWVNGKVNCKGQCAVDFSGQPDAESFSKEVKEMAARASGCLEVHQIVIVGVFKL